MRIIRFIAEDGRTLLGEDLGDGRATVLLDAQGVLGAKQEDQARRALLRGKRALVADDDPGIRRAIGAVLDKFDCACTLCKDGAEALQAIRVHQLDLVISDIVMPHHDGYEIFAAAKSRPAPPAVLLVTGFGYDPNHTVVRACADGLDAVLYKPFTPHQLVERVVQAMQRSANGRLGPLVRTKETQSIERLLAPIEPNDILCVGRNYPDPVASGDAGDLELFMKPHAALQGPGGPIRLPAFDDVEPRVDCEGELAVVIGRTARDVPEVDALDHVLGFVAANDVTARRWQPASGPGAWMRGKGFDTFCPIGPAIVTPDDVATPDALDVTTTVNGRVVRRGNTAEMIRPIRRLVSEVSRHVTLPAGTLLLTGAPPPVDGEPATCLQPGDEVCVEIGGVGRLVNPVVAE